MADDLFAVHHEPITRIIAGEIRADKSEQLLRERNRLHPITLDLRQVRPQHLRMKDSKTRVGREQEQAESEARARPSALPPVVGQIRNQQKYAGYQHETLPG